MPPHTFPNNFVWGVASSSYQIEGAAKEDGRGDSIWDTFCRKEGSIWLNQTGDIACDHYHRYRDDVGLIKQIGAKAYRLSMAWPRVVPDGTGAPNSKGLDFYSRLIDALLANQITPYITLFHWDYPQSLYDRGGWLKRESADWFANYVGVVIDHLSDRVQHWMTLNEPQVFIKFGHGDGHNAPGLKLPLSDQLQVAHHVLLAHGKAVQTIRARAKTKPQIGWAPVCVVKYPQVCHDHAGATATHRSTPPVEAGMVVPTSEDIQAARQLTCGITQPDLWNNTWFNDPIFKGRYPEDGLKLYGNAVPRFDPKDLQTINQPLDFLGLNIYEGQPVRADADGRAVNVDRPVGHPLTAFRWPVEPESLYWGPRFMHERYKTPIYITENGLSNIDWVSLDGKVHDPQRIDFTQRYLRALRRASHDGADIRGYFHWSLMDNFEWASGYKERFGLVFVDYPTQRRILKDSAHWYRGVIESNGSALDAI